MGSEMCIRDSPKLIDHLGKAVERLRAKHYIDERRSRGYCRALLASYATTDADDQVRAFDFKSSPPTLFVKYFLLSFLSYCTGV